MSQATIKTVPPGLSRDLHTLQQKGSSILPSQLGLAGRSSPERVVTIHKSPAQLYFLFGIFIIPRRCKYANEAGGPPEAKGVTWETKPRPVGCHLFNLSSDMALEKLVTWRLDHNGIKSFLKSPLNFYPFLSTCLSSIETKIWIS